MTAAESSSVAPRHIYQSLVDRLNFFRARVRDRLVFEGIARLIGSIVLLALLSFALDRVFRLSLAARLAVLAAASVAVCVLIWRHIIAPLRLTLDPLTLAAALDKMAGQHGELVAHVGTILELPAMLDKPAGESTLMLQQAAARCHAALSDISFAARLNDSRRNLAGFAIAIALLLPIALVSAAPNTARLWAQRLLAGSNEPWPQKTYLQIAGMENGSIVVARGEPFVLRVNVKPGGVIPETVSVRFREAGSDRVDANLTAFGPNDFRYDFASIDAPITVEVTGGDDTVGPFTLHPADRPKIADIKLIARHPTEKQSSTFSFNGSDSDLSFLPRTKMQLLITSNTPVASATLKTSTTQPARADLQQLDDTHFSIRWTHATAVQLEINLVSKEARLSSVPTSIAIGLKTDQPPRVTIGYTGVKSRVTTRAKIPLTIDARDDYGLAAVGLISKAETTDPMHPSQLTAHVETTSLFGPANPATETEVQLKKMLDLEPLKLSIGSLITLNASATDACYTGAQSMPSRQITFRVVAPEDLFREILLRQQAERAKFRKQADEARAIREQLNELSSADLASGVARRHRVMQREITRIQTALSESLTEMKLNALGTDEAYEMMQSKVLSPLQQLNDELLNPQKEALDALKFDDSGAVTSDANRQDQSIDRMELILKQMSQWDSFVDVLNQLNEIIKLQTQAQQRAAELKKTETENIFDK